MPGPLVARGERVTLRTAEPEDAGFVQRAAANPAVRYPVGNPVMTRERVEELLADGADRFVVCLDGDDAGEGRTEDTRPIGDVSVTDADYKRPEVGFWLAPEVHGEGYGREAVSLAVDFAFREYPAPAVGAAAFDFNDASRRLLESLGFEEEGRQRRFMFVDGEHRDMVRYGLLREEWEQA